MTIEEKAKAYDEALKRAKKYNIDGAHAYQGTVVKLISPELKESEDEKIMKRIHLCLDECVHSDIIRDYERDECLAYLKKQKESLHISETCKENPDSFTDDEKIRKDIIHYILYKATDISEEQEHSWITYLEKQKEPHYTKRNALFDKCVENCDPEVMQSVSDEVDEMLRKEQKPVDYEEELEKCRKNPLYFFDKYVKIKMKPAEWSEKDSLHLANAVLSAEKEWGNESCTATWLKSLPERFNLPPKQKWSEKTGKLCLEAASLLSDYAEGVEMNSPLGQKIQRAHTFLLDLYHEAFYPKTYNPRPDILPAEWSEEDKETLEKLHRLLVICRGEKKFIQEADYNKMDNLLKSLRPSWKPSEEQMKALQNAVALTACNKELARLYNQLKRL